MTATTIMTTDIMISSVVRTGAAAASVGSGAAGVGRVDVMGLFVTLMYAQLGTSHAGSCADTIGKVTNVAAKVKIVTKAIADSLDLFFHVFIFCSQFFATTFLYVNVIYLKFSKLCV